MSSLMHDRDWVKPIRREIAVLSKGAIFFRSVVAGVAVLCFAIGVQWYSYFKWMHAGSVIAGGLMFALVFRTLDSARQRKIEIIHRLRTIGWMSDRIRNSLQAIECLTYAAAPNAADDVRNSVDTIESILTDFLADRDSRAAPERTSELSGELSRS